MCGRFTLYHDDAELQERFHAIVAEESRRLEPRYNIAPSQEITTVCEDRGRQLMAMQWGLIPAWAKDGGRPLINVRADTLAAKPYFRRALTHRRCLIPASGFYEWKEADNPREGGKTPIYFQPVDGALLGLAGIWEEQTDADGSPRLTCAIVTTEPNALLGLVHNRMPVIVPRGAQDLWLDPAQTDAADLLALLAPYTEADLEAFPVSRLVNAPGNDTPLCIEPAGDPLRAAAVSD